MCKDFCMFVIQSQNTTVKYEIQWKVQEYAYKSVIFAVNLEKDGKISGLTVQKSGWMYLNIHVKWKNKVSCKQTHLWTSIFKYMSMEN